MLKSLIPALALASALATPVVSFAQSNEPVTRAQVRADLVQLEQVGYHASGGHTTYPVEIQAAEAKVAAQNGAASGYGGVVAGSSEAERPAAVSMADSNTYRHH
ncbi:MAG TPA: DUF4148 domain-containing protein [Trinickia sp.]|jgi:hypothetical protein|uniref:DUF4148 domain-containing protein n=1 Tax=Trinickia sp. TaxID=2571163 RepID=UPI002BADF9C2|nr:DUF4148 domain-containing protein [Trinickia sp.]HTI18147.1 DUF4148 domain-containing protein [Trinickia sp.]